MNKVISQYKKQFEEAKKKDEEIVQKMNAALTNSNALIEEYQKKLSENVLSGNLQEYTRVKSVLREAEDEREAVTKWLNSGNDNRNAKEAYPEIVNGIKEEQKKLQEEGKKEILKTAKELISVLTKYRTQINDGNKQIENMYYFLKVKSEVPPTTNDFLINTAKVSNDLEWLVSFMETGKAPVFSKDHSACIEDKK